jgi:molybdopterin biosynthesis enzyme
MHDVSGGRSRRDLCRPPARYKIDVLQSSASMQRVREVGPMLRTSRLLLPAGFVITTLVMLFVTAVGYRALRHARESTLSVAHTQQVLKALNGTSCPCGDSTNRSLRNVELRQYCGAASMTTWYWFRPMYIVETWR